LLVRAWPQAFSDQFRKIIGHRLENTPQGLKSWMRLIFAADRRIDFRASAAISAAFVARSRRLAFPKTSLGSILTVRAGARRRREGLMTDQTDLTTFHVRSNALR